MDKNTVLICMNTIENDSLKQLFVEYLKQLDTQQSHYIIASADKSVEELLRENALSYSFHYLKKSSYTKLEKILIHLGNKPFLNKLLKKKVNSIFSNKAKKRIKGISFDKLVYIFDSQFYALREMGSLKCKKEYIDVNDLLLGKSALSDAHKSNRHYVKHHFDKIDSFQLDHYGDLYSKSVKFVLKKHSIVKKGNTYVFTMDLKMKSIFNIDSKKIKVKINECVYETHTQTDGNVLRVEFSIDEKVLVYLATQNKIFMFYENEDIGFEKGIIYTDSKKKFMKSKIYSIDGKTSFYLRQSSYNNLFLTVRLTNRTDLPKEEFKINLAYYLSQFIKKDIYLLYEKDSARYEESASVLYERLIDEGYSNAYYILDKNSPHYASVGEKYRKNIIPKYSFKHYLYFFISKNFFGSELMVHAMELRIMNRHVLEKIDSLDNNYVFLQHGVMYMISLDSESRKYFTPRKDGKGKFRVVTSSHEEARHFVELGNYPQEQVIVCGLPKFDRNVLHDDADKIVVMPTWRAWEYNQATTDFKETPYYKMLEGIEKSIDDQYKDRLIILPHPLFAKAAKDNEFELRKYMKFNVKYNDILKDTRVLITDYSSIAYDAFYRGSNVIFYWEELDECIKNYGANAKLMLNKDNVFGDVCYNDEDLKKVLSLNYKNSQNALYKERYQKLVEFQDGKNTDRLIKKLIEEKIIKK